MTRTSTLIANNGLAESTDGYTVQTILGCRMIFGLVPLSDLQMLIHGYSKNAVMSADIASRIGASLVIGEPDAIERLRQSDLPVADQRIRDAQHAAEKGLPAAIIDWLRNGERGLSSNAMCQAMFGLPNDQPGTEYPLDPDDLGRCIKFLDAIGEEHKFLMAKLADVSKEWAGLVSVWGELEAIYLVEQPTGIFLHTGELMEKAMRGIK